MKQQQAKDNKRNRWIAAGAFAGALILNSLAGATTLLGGHDTAAVSAMYPTLFTPAGYTFAIWGVIYLLLIGYTAYQLGLIRPKKAKLKPAMIDAITPYFIASSVLNAVWIIAWQYEVLWLSVLLIGGMLYSLIRITEILKDKDYTMAEHILVRTPFSVYFGWITVATIADICVWLVSIKWDAWGIAPEAWTVGLLIVAALIGMAGMVRNRDCAYGAVFIWAFVGILNNHVAANGWNGQYQLVIGALWALIAVLTVVCGLTFHSVYRRVAAKS